MKRFLLDVNVVFALLVEFHVHHKSAWKWWGAAANDSVAWCLPVRLGVLRLLTNRLAMAESPVSSDKALAVWDAFARDERVFEVEIPTDQIDLFFRKNVSGRPSSPNLWTDAWLAACAESAGMGLVSFDRGFRLFHSLDFVHLSPRQKN